jgi:S1-C subfamily serine protease
MDDTIRKIIEVLYSRAAPLLLKVPLAEVIDLFPVEQKNDVEATIEILNLQGLLRIPFARDGLGLTVAGKLAYEKRCAAEMCLGEQYIARQYRSGVAHVIVRNALGDEAGGTGFFCSDFPGWLATAKHVVYERTILRILDPEGNTIGEDGEIRYAERGADLALVRCAPPQGTASLRLEWNPEEVKELDPVLIMGYPPLAGHKPALVHAAGQISAIATKWVEPEHRSLIISRVTEPGYSGGPVINRRGYVVGVVEQQNEMTRTDGSINILISATPAYYFHEIQLLRTRPVNPGYVTET